MAIQRRHDAACPREGAGRRNHSRGRHWPGSRVERVRASSAIRRRAPRAIAATAGAEARARRGRETDRSPFAPAAPDKVEPLRRAAEPRGMRQRRGGGSCALPRNRDCAMRAQLGERRAEPGVIAARARHRPSSPHGARAASAGMKRAARPRQAGARNSRVRPSATPASSKARADGASRSAPRMRAAQRIGPAAAARQ